MKVSVWKSNNHCSFDELTWRMHRKKRKNRGGKINFNVSGVVQARKNREKKVCNN